MGILGKITPISTEYTLLYVVPTARKAVCTVAITNTSEAVNTVSVALSSSNDLEVAAINVAAGGTGLVSIPTLTVAGTGSGAEVSVSSVKLTEYNINTGGTGYTIGDVLTLIGGEGTAAKLTVTAVDGDGAVTATTISTAGAYTSIITGAVATDTAITVTGGTGVDFTVTIADIFYGINMIAVDAAGNNYTSAPTVTVSAGTGIVLAAQMTRAAIQDNDAIEWGVRIPNAGVLERTALTLSAGEAIYIKSGIVGGLNAFVFGITEIA
jgi:hypothetical protein